MMTLAELDATMQLYGVGVAVRSRVLRLNPKGIQEGVRPRGYHPKYAVARFDPLLQNLMRRGEFIRRFGRAAWSKIPKSRIFRDGRRQAVGAATLYELGFTADV